MITRRVHKFNASVGAFASRASLEDKLQKELAPAERIVGTHYEDGSWWIITESYGLGPHKGSVA